MTSLFYDQLATPEGVFLIYYNDQGIYEIAFPGQMPDPDMAQKNIPWPDLAEDLESYFKGIEIDWSKYPLNRSGYGAFSTRLLEIVSEIPYGSVITYREAAVLAGSPKAWRAAGQALAANRHPIIVPCHRVISSSGKIGGFSGPPGWKEMLLAIESGETSTFN